MRYGFIKTRYASRDMGSKILRLVRDFARKKWPLRGNLQMTLINLPLWQRGIERDFPDLKSPLAPLF
jgi:hypothetical protein